jgi:hypothetical protein
MRFIPNENSLLIYDHYLYKIYREDNKIYDVDKDGEITSIRDTVNNKFRVGDTVLVTDAGEYAEIIEVQIDNVWGNHEYDIHFFSGLHNSRWRDENELERA